MRDMTSFNMWNESATNARDPTAYPERRREEGLIKRLTQELKLRMWQAHDMKVRLTYDDFDEEERCIDDQQCNQSCFS